MWKKPSGSNNSMFAIGEYKLGIATISLAVLKLT